MLRHTGQLPPDTSRALNRFLLYVSLPALVLWKVAPLVRSPALGPGVLAAIAMPWLMFAAVWLVVPPLGRRLGWSAATNGALTLCVGLGNTLFVGYPLIEWRLGQGALPLAVLVDQLGSFLVLSTVAVLAAASFASAAGHPMTARHRGVVMVQRLASFPPFWALLLALAWGALGSFESPPAVFALLEKLAAPLTPVALFSVGASLEIKPNVLRARRGPVLFGLACKLVVWPALCLLLYRGALGLRGPVLAVTLLQAAMPPMTTSAVLVSEFGLDEQLASLLLGLGIPLAIATVYAWSLVLAFV